MNKTRLIKVGFLIIGDSIFLYFALLAGLFLRYFPYLDYFLIMQHLTSFTIIFMVWLILFGAFGLYDLRFMKNSKLFLFRLGRAMVTNIVAAIIIFYFLPYFQIEPRRNLLIIASLAAILIFFWRYIFNLIIIRAPTSRLLFFGTNTETIGLAEYLLANPQLGQKPIGLISNSNTSHAGNPLPYFSLTAQKLTAVVRDTAADTVIISRNLYEDKNLTKILFQMIPRGIAVIEFTKLHEMMTGKIPLSLIGELWFVENLVGIKKGMYEFFKRATDITLGALFLAPSLILLPLIAAAIKLDSDGPIFFRQKRVGRLGRLFEVRKYRSMVKDAEKISGFKSGDGGDARLTRVGAFLRKSYLDELPQIINIMKGEMSFVGPRPERPEYVDILNKKIPFYEMRLLVTPGLTGWAQVNMENDASVEDSPEKMQFDLYYIKNRSFMLDLLIILRTISALLRRQGR